MKICTDQQCGNWTTRYKNHCHAYNKIKTNPQQCEARMSMEKARAISALHEWERKKQKMGLYIGIGENDT
ncbi:hypothetical protein [Eubacterium barkeri]|uniref:Uncharacterized protein n=1 Tax=Eubacterium barkeri TaxID=1528 RepID=A0A1H3AIL4_EUBBA|nr:hypothetical protein [Eubacterium barkeri]SDX28679.1 hypothetical protein SAMN04488579_10133 [Eubacterium barkeri]